MLPAHPPHAHANNSYCFFGGGPGPGTSESHVGLRRAFQFQAWAITLSSTVNHMLKLGGQREENCQVGPNTLHAHARTSGHSPSLPRNHTHFMRRTYFRHGPVLYQEGQTHFPRTRLSGQACISPSRGRAEFEAIPPMRRGRPSSTAHVKALRGETLSRMGGFPK